MYFGGNIRRRQVLVKPNPNSHLQNCPENQVDLLFLRARIDLLKKVKVVDLEKDLTEKDQR
jgi:hypothetical protein